MSAPSAVPTPSYLGSLEQIVAEIVEPHAIAVDQSGVFSRAALDALGAAGLLGFISAVEVGGLGQGHRAATRVVERLAEACASRVAGYRFLEIAVDAAGFYDRAGRITERDYHY